MRIIVSHNLLHAGDEAMRQILDSFDVEPHGRESLTSLAGVNFETKHMSVTQSEVLPEMDIWIDDHAIIRALQMYAKLARIFGPVILAFKRCCAEAEGIVNEFVESFK